MPAPSWFAPLDLSADDRVLCLASVYDGNGKEALHLIKTVQRVVEAQGVEMFVQCYGRTLVGPVKRIMDMLYLDIPMAKGTDLAMAVQETLSAPPLPGKAWPTLVVVALDGQGLDAPLPPLTVNGQPLPWVMITPTPAAEANVRRVWAGRNDAPPVVRWSYADIDRMIEQRALDDMEVAPDATHSHVRRRL